MHEDWNFECRKRLSAINIWESFHIEKSTVTYLRFQFFEKNKRIKIQQRNRFRE